PDFVTARNRGATKSGRSGPAANGPRIARRQAGSPFWGYLADGPSNHRMVGWPPESGRAVANWAKDRRVFKVLLAEPLDQRSQYEPFGSVWYGEEDSELLDRLLLFLSPRTSARHSRRYDKWRAFLAEQPAQGHRPRHRSSISAGGLR